MVGRKQASIEVGLPDTSTADGITKALAAVVGATARGELTPGEAQALSSIIEVQRKTLETAELETRLQRLEQASAARGAP